MDLTGHRYLISSSAGLMTINPPIVTGVTPRRPTYQYILLYVYQATYRHEDIPWCLNYHLFEGVVRGRASEQEQEQMKGGASEEGDG